MCRLRLQVIQAARGPHHNCWRSRRPRHPALAVASALLLLPPPPPPTIPRPAPRGPRQPAHGTSSATTRRAPTARHPRRPSPSQTLQRASRPRELRGGLTTVVRRSTHHPPPPQPPPSPPAPSAPGRCSRARGVGNTYSIGMLLLPPAAPLQPMVMMRQRRRRERQRWRPLRRRPRRHALLLSFSFSSSCSAFASSPVHYRDQVAASAPQAGATRRTKARRPQTAATAVAAAAAWRPAVAPARWPARPRPLAQAAGPAPPFGARARASTIR